MSKRIIHVVAPVLTLLCGLAAAQAVSEFPRKEDPLATRVDLFDKLMRGNHCNEGLMMPHVIFPPAGKDTFVTGPYQHIPMVTGEYLAALSFRYAVSQDPQVRTWADQTMAGILKLEEVTGEAGCVARGFYHGETPGWHEEAFPYASKWHASSALSGYRWMGGISDDQFTGLLFGVGVYWELCADDVHKKAAAGFVDRVISRCVEKNLLLTDLDGKMTPWGNFCPDLPHENRSALLALGLLKSAGEITGNQAFQTAYQRVITKYKYDDQAVLAKVLDSAAQCGVDDMAEAMMLYQLIRLEKDESLVRKYRMSLNRFWSVWKNGDDPFFALLYQVLTKEKVVDDAVVGRIKSLWGFDRVKESYVGVGDSGGQTTMEADVEGNAAGLLFTYWFGRFNELVDAAW